MEIKTDPLTHPQVLELLQQHLNDMNSNSPEESVHALDVSGLKHPSVTFWTVWEDEQLLGCGALKQLDQHHGEIKSMRTTALARKQGVASKLLEHIIEHAKGEGYQRLSLETGSMAFFSPARRLYHRYRFNECEPFGDYQLDPYSLFMTREL
ncbi:GNAT family N-acetyltransferase [Vibrio sp. AK197]